MNFKFKLGLVKSIYEIPGYWTEQDYLNLLDILEVTGTQNLSASEIFEMLQMALTDLDTDEAAKILLTYKLENKLSRGQIENLSHQMTEDESDEYPLIELHFPFFNINQLLYRAFNGQFPHSKATQVEFSLELEEIPPAAVTKAIVLMAFSQVLSPNNPLVRLFAAQLTGKEAFPEAEHIIWRLTHQGDFNYALITSDFWINKEDIDVNGAEGRLLIVGDKSRRNT